jgi:deoxycytidylate deaminase
MRRDTTEYSVGTKLEILTLEFDMIYRVLNYLCSTRNKCILGRAGVTFTSNQNKILWQNANGYVRKASNCDNSLPYFVELSLFSHGRDLVSVRKIGLLSHIARKTKGLSAILEVRG